VDHRKNIMKAAIAACCMVATLFVALIFKPNEKSLVKAAGVDLELLVPKSVGEWRTEPRALAVVNPQTKAILDKIYSQILTRTYVNSKGQMVMLSIAYGSDQRGALQAHKPEVCYPAQGFIVASSSTAELATPLGAIGVNRMFAAKGSRFEPVTYWFTVGDQQVKSAMERRMISLKSIVTGQIPDGLLFRVSSLDRDPTTAYKLHDEFVNQLLSSVSPAGRARLAGFSIQ
jgi:EpsI family protein